MAVSQALVITPSAYCCIPLQPTSPCTNQPKAFVLAEACPYLSSCEPNGYNNWCCAGDVGKFVQRRPCDFIPRPQSK